MSTPTKLSIRINKTTAPIYEELQATGLGASDMVNNFLLYYKANKADVSAFMARRISDRNSLRQASAAGAINKAINQDSDALAVATKLLEAQNN